MPLLNDVGKLALETMANYVGLRGYLNIRWKEAWQDPLVFNNEINFWETLFENDYGEFLFVNKGRPIYLKHFRLSTWVPFIPGMFYKRSTIDGYRFSGRVLRHDKGEIILNMSSKTEFVMNGFANVRYERVEIDNESYLLLNAFTTSNSALGIPVLVRDRDLDLHNLRDIETKLKFEIQGTLDYFTSDDPRFSFATLTNKVPIIRATHKFAIIETGTHQLNADASAWSLIDVWDNNFRKPCCAFASFSIGDRSSLNDANNFLKDYIRNEYNTNRYNVLTDFDEVSPNLNAEFGIRDIGRNELLIRAFRDIKKKYKL